MMLTNLLLLLALLSFSAASAQPPPAAAAAPDSSAPTDIVRILTKSGGFTTLIRLLKTTQVSSQVNSQLSNSNNGLTFFAPTDNAFAALKPGFLNSLSDQQKNELVQFHIIPTFVSLSSFDTLSNPVRTQAGDDPYRLALNVTSSGSAVNVTTGVVNATVGGNVYSDKQLAVYQMDKVLLPRDFFVPKPPPPPAAAPAKGAEKRDAAEGPGGDEKDDDSASCRVALEQKNGGVWVIGGVVAAVAFSLLQR